MIRGILALSIIISGPLSGFMAAAENPLALLIWILFIASIIGFHELNEKGLQQ